MIWDSTLENQKTELALEGSGFGVWTFDPQSEKLVWDDKMYCIYGHTRETFNESPGTWASCLHPEDVDLVSERFAELIKGKPVNIFEFRIVQTLGQIGANHRSQWNLPNRLFWKCQTGCGDESGYHRSQT